MIFEVDPFFGEILLDYMVSGKLKVTLGKHMVKYCCQLLRPGTLKSAMFQE